MQPIAVGYWRTGAMQVISGPYGHEKIHYEAPAHTRLIQEMHVFLHWFATESAMDAILKAALAHFWLVTLHPFDDGNGRIARAIADMQLARSEENHHRFCGR